MNDVLRVRAPATTANIGPGFDCAGAALELWNELELGPGNGTVDREHLGVRAFELLGLGIELEGHGDNLAAALAGGVCLTWGTRIARIADTTPATPIAVVPTARVDTQASRAALPPAVPHADAAVSAGRAALLGAALATSSADLFAAALEDRLHEPYRAESAPLLAEIREHLPAAALGATLSGAGPTVIVWARLGEEAACTDELRSRFPDEQVLPLAISQTGAGPT